ASAAARAWLRARWPPFRLSGRRPAPRGGPQSLNAVLTDPLALYPGVVPGTIIDREFAPGLPPVRLDVEQIRRVVINLVDNALEALAGAPGGRIVVQTQHDAANAVARIVIADNGPGVPPAHPQQPFIPYYSTTPP